MTPLQRLARRLSSNTTLSLAAHLVPGLRGAVQAAAEAEYREVAERERAARGIHLPRRGDGRCCWCGARRLARRGVLVEGDLVWIMELPGSPTVAERVEAAERFMGCPGHELFEEAAQRIAVENGAPDYPCPGDPDGVHFVGCGCSA